MGALKRKQAQRAREQAIARGQWTDGRKALTAYTAQGVIEYQEDELNEAFLYLRRLEKLGLGDI